MRKYMIICFVILFTLLNNPSFSYAHSSLQGTSPEEGETVTHPLDIITFKFSSEIKEGSKFTLTDQDGKSIEIQSIDLKDNVMLGQLSKTLPTGTYTVSYKIISQDSHVVEDDFTFSVESEESTENTDENPSTGEDKEPSDKGQPDEKAADSSETPKGKVENGLSPVVIGIAAITIVCGVGVIWWILRKKAVK
ncbi:copper resistance CopC family protein [Bacillus sp. Marseille-Q3570]|uniref:copper resistance CopC family protein n=1 Tax=Bacillus sp. Marseille-Q3570 TaxID=2963522 RepID=UPI0021B7B8E4|nr:copper resistance CopC family protein [Bacillus sp. Marseille-Q3570]